MGNDPLPLKTLSQRVILLSPFSRYLPCQHPLPSLLRQQLKRAESPDHLVFLNTLASKLPLKTIFTGTQFSLAFCPALEPFDSQGCEVQTAPVNSLHIRLSEIRGEHPNSYSVNIILTASHTAVHLQGSFFTHCDSATGFVLAQEPF